MVASDIMMDQYPFELPDGVSEGMDLAGKYRIGRRIGLGAMGIVVAARHKLLEQNVAIKFLLADRLDQADAIPRFIHEARSAMSIQNEHVVRVLDVAVLENGIPYIVMEYLEGTDLATRLRERGPLPVQEAVDYVLEASEAIAEAHRSGIVHRDLKPANLFLLEREGAAPTIKVLDFGISKSTGGDSAPMIERDRAPWSEASDGAQTAPKAILGSPFYMAPEQIECSRDVDARADIWALGVTFYELVTGELPYVGHSVVQIYSRMTAAGPRIWAEALDRLPSGLDVALAKCLKANRRHRYRDVGEFARALAPFGSYRARVAAERISRTLAKPGTDAPNAPGTARGRRAPPWLGFVALMLVGMVAGFVATAPWWSSSPARQPRSAAAATSAPELIPISVATDRPPLDDATELSAPVPSEGTDPPKLPIGPGRNDQSARPPLPVVPKSAGMAPAPGFSNDPQRAALSTGPTLARQSAMAASIDVRSAPSAIAATNPDARSLPTSVFSTRFDAGTIREVLRNRE